MGTGGILGSIWAVHLFPGAPGVHPLNPEFGFFMSHGFVLVKGNQHGHCDLVHKIWQRNHSLEYVVHHAIQMMKKKLTCSIRKKKWRSGKWKIYVDFFMWSYNWDSEILLLRLFFPHFRDHFIPLIPATASAGLFQYWSQRRRQGKSFVIAQFLFN